MTEKRKLSTVLYDELIPLGDGRNLRMMFDLAETLPKVERYVTELTYTRGLPANMDAIPPKDPVLTYVTGHYADQLKKKILDESFVTNRVIGYYTEAREEVAREASLIALFSHPDNTTVLSEEPEPYPTVQEEADPLVLQMPVITKNLAHPIERRLKRLSDLLTQTGAIFQVKEFIDQLGVKMNMFALELVEVDEDGFLPATADGDVPAKILADDVQPKVQAGRSAGKRVPRPDGAAE